MRTNHAQCVRIVQCLCSMRHALLACAYLSPDGEPQADKSTLLHDQIDGMILLGLVNPWCDICGQPQENWKYEDARTRFKNLTEAEPHLLHLAKLQSATASALRERRAS